ncbi:hypothetical protein KW830_05890 [Comamonas sp. CMM03]|uniref:hypothetical protein n=1 Tax=Comamonas sp. CMM03 TaxID=2854781 RepID=UPI001C43F1A0|nr:hypothetical protein [Comamonas sp. CMM03]MBV7417985.1 hypothetical protein [Comamonas sp. CMM03]
MKTQVVFVSRLPQAKTESSFFDLIRSTPEISQNYIVSKGNVYAVGDLVKEHIAENGVSSMFWTHITCDSVSHPGITIDEVEDLVLRFVRKLNGVKNLFITDAYIYHHQGDPELVNLFEKMIRELSRDLERVTFFADPKKRSPEGVAAMHEAIKRVSSEIEIEDIKTSEFHDRFWLNSDNNSGVVMGASLNGFKRKIALIDHLRNGDAYQLVELAKKARELVVKAV